ncbi:hypothetical protein C900_00380 [Fulvivirga imtechensis AK7]|uniref:Uncharacterized protein n=1 Tax=Fulvivirga imtechensis AK7 TaxID=1237149 RepID=L8JLZ9_9BACT|nr:hypothetical protein C900_00380 [Fulvivirga imtechensis AK7]
MSLSSKSTEVVGYLGMTGLLRQLQVQTAVKARPFMDEV